jgi:hypothetical protein
MEEAVDGLEALNRKAMSEIRGYARPPKYAQMVLECVCLLLDRTCDLKWQSVRRIVSASSFIEKLKTTVPSDIGPRQLRQAKKYIANPDFSEKTVEMVAALPCLVTWCRAIVTAAGPQAAEATGPRAEPSPRLPLKDEDDQPEELAIDPSPAALSEEEKSCVQNLTVTKPGVGSITFPGITDIRGLDISSIVHLDIGEVLVYPDSESKPPPGEGLNRQATITLYQCWPSDDHTQLLNPTKAEKYRNKIKAMTEKKNAHFLDYDCSTGVWMFQVEQF